MQIEHVYRCMRCGKEVVIPVSGDLHMMSVPGQDFITDGIPENHYCDQDRGIVGRLELIGMNVRG